MITDNKIYGNSVPTVDDVLKNPQGFDFNISDRFLGIMAGTTAKGNDPSNVYEAVRKFGLIPEEMLPWSEDIKTAEDYYSFKGADKEACYRAGREWLSKKSFLHQWVFNPSAPLSEKINNMKVALKYSPLCVDVYAWQMDDKGFYVRGGQSGHWTTCYNVKDFEYIFDSYFPHGKILTPDFNFYFCKRISVEKLSTFTKVPIERVWGSVWETWFNKIINLLKIS